MKFFGKNVSWVFHDYSITIQLHNWTFIWRRYPGKSTFWYLESGAIHKMFLTLTDNQVLNCENKKKERKKKNNNKKKNNAKTP